GLSVGSIAPGTLSFFAGATTTGALHPGQIVAVHVSTFTAASGIIIASCNADTVILRWSRLTATPSVVGTQTLGATSLPTYFASTSGNIGVQLFQGAQGQKGVTSFDGIPDGSFLNTAKPASFRALFIEDPSNSVNFPYNRPRKRMTKHSFSRGQNPTHGRIRWHRRCVGRRRHTWGNHRLEAAVKRQRNCPDTPEYRGKLHPAAHVRNRRAQAHNYKPHGHSPNQRPKLARAAHQPLPDHCSHDDLREIKRRIPK